MTPSARPAGPAPAAQRRRFGAFGGVFLPSLLSILGIILYLRLGWVVGEAGLGGALLILFVAHLISGLTGLSIASLATARTVGVGGAYFLISRALGAPAGIAVGLPLYLAQALSVGFYLVGFAQVLAFLLPHWDPRLSGSLALAGLAVLTLLGTNLSVRFQYPVALAILLSLAALYGAPAAVGIVRPEWWGRAGLTAVFGVFFPAVTGIMAGVGMSGDLRRPRRDLPLGVLGAIGVGLSIYASLMVLFAMRADPQALIGDLFVAWRVTRIPALITTGVLAAALSSALGALLAAPRTLQAIAADGFAPAPLAKASGRTGEPRRALAVTLVVAEGAVLAGDLNQVATLLTLFFLVSYAAVNLVCGLEAWAANPGFRPGFKLPWSLSMTAALLCVSTMGLLDLPFTLLALVVVAALYIWAGRRHSRARFGDDRSGLMAAVVRTVLYRLQRVPASAGGWRPNLLVFSGATPRRSFMLKIAVAMVRESGMVSLFHLEVGDPLGQGAEARQREARIEQSLNQAFPAVACRVALVGNVFDAIPVAVQAYGVGRFAANTVMLGWPARRRHWRGFFRTWLRLSGLGKSVILVHHEPTRHAEHPRRMDLWWRGGVGTGAMLVLLGYLLARHEGEQVCHVRLLAAARTAEGRRRAQGALDKLVQQAHIPLETQVFALPAGGLYACIAEQSAAVDLVMIGVRLPRDPARATDFMAAQADLIGALPTTLLLSSARGFEGRDALFEEEG